MKTLKTLGLAIMMTAAVAMPAFAADKYSFDAHHTAITWHASHFGFSTPSGKFTDVTGHVMLDEQNPATSSVEVTIKTASLSTGLADFDDHLKAPKFLDVVKFPEAKFVSEKVEKTGDKTAKVTGQLTLHGVTKPAVLEVTLNKIDMSPITQKKTAGFSATTTIKRSEFGITEYVPNISDDLKIEIEAEAAVQG